MYVVNFYDNGLEDVGKLEANLLSETYGVEFPLQLTWSCTLNPN